MINKFLIGLNPNKNTGNWITGVPGVLFGAATGRWLIALGALAFAS